MLTSSIAVAEPVAGTLPKDARDFDCCVVGRGASSIHRLLKSRFRMPGLTGPADERMFRSSRIAIFSRIDEAELSPYSAMAQGAMVLLEERDAAALNDALRAGVHFSTFRDPHELLEKLTRFIKRSDLRNRIANAARQQVHQRYAAQLRATSINQPIKSHANEAGQEVQQLHREPPADSIDLQTAATTQRWATDDELLQLIAVSAERVLDISAGDGTLAARIKKRQGAWITGVVRQGDEEIAHPRFDGLFVAESSDDPFPTLSSGDFDCIVVRRLAGSLTHAAALLRQLHARLTPGGQLILEVANAAHCSRISALLNGECPDPSAVSLSGEAVAALLDAIGFRTVCVTARNNDQAQLSDQDQRRLRDLGLSDVGQRPTMATLSHLFEAVRRQPPMEEVSIIIPAQRKIEPSLLNSVIATLEGVRAEIVIAGAAANEELLAQIQPGALVGGCRILRTRADAPFWNLISLAAAECRAEYLAILAPDTRVTVGWLRRMLNTLTATPSVALVGPVIDTDREMTLSTAIADIHAAACAGKMRSTTELSSACVLVRRTDLAKLEWLISLGDELPNVQLSQAARDKGLAAAVAVDVLVRRDAELAPRWAALLEHTQQANQADDDSEANDPALEPALAQSVRILNLVALPFDQKTEQGILCELREVALGTARFDSVLLGNLLSHLPESTAVLQAIRDCLIADGTLQLQFPNAASAAEIKRSLAADAAEQLQWERLYIANKLTPISIGRVLNRAGFDVQSMTPKGKRDRRPTDRHADIYMVTAKPAPRSMNLRQVEAASRALPPETAFVAEITSNGLSLKEEPLCLSLCMIVRDSVKTIGPCLRSVRNFVDEMIVVDTGSVDQTPELAAKLGACVYHYPWNASFSAARNESLRHARGRWIFWMDADDTISPENGRRLRERAASAPIEGVSGYVMQVHCPGTGNAAEATVVDHVKLFRNRPDLRFEGRIHEQILPSIRRINGEVEWTDIYVTHSGADYSPAARRRKFERDVRLLHLELRDQPGHSFVLFNLGMTHADVGEHEQAVEFLRKSLEACNPGESHVRKIYALLAASLSQLERHEESLRICHEGLQIFPLDVELNFRAALAAHRLGKLALAERGYQKVLAGGDERHFSSVDRGIGSFKTHFNLAAVCLDMHRPDDAEEQYIRATELAPGWLLGWQGLLQLLLDMRKTEAARQHLARMAASPSLDAHVEAYRQQLDAEAEEVEALAAH